MPDRLLPPRNVLAAAEAAGRESELRDIAVIIPAWQPTMLLVALLKDLLSRGFVRLLVVDDGSDGVHQAVFAAATALPGVEVLRHMVNGGKGRALKSAFSHILQAGYTPLGVVTADADGQHAPEDIQLVAEALLAKSHRAVLGTRAFDGDVPSRSSYGNALTRQIFHLVTGVRLRDTQTGLRGLPLAVLPELNTLPGERYEYEMTMLAHLCRSGHVPREVLIKTIYLENNRGSHFDPVWDSMRIYLVLLRQALPARARVARWIRWVTGACVLFQLLSLRIGLLNRFFFDTLHADTQGIDYYCLPKAWLNLRAGRSLYGTFDPPTYGPHFTWYLAHPLLAMLGWPLSRLDPADSYGVFTLLSLSAMMCCGTLLARETPDPLRRSLVWLAMLGAFPTFAMLYVGNVQSLTVLGLTLLFIGLLRVARSQGGSQQFVLAGLLVSLFTKPVVLLLLPLLLLLRESRGAAWRSLAIYLPVSLAFELTPFLNPQAIGLNRVFWLAIHPAFVRATMNIYANHMLLTPDMRDNSIHWLNLVAQSGFRLAHIDVFSLPAFLDTLVGARTPDWIYAVPPLAVLLLSVLITRTRSLASKQEAALLLSLAGSLSFFLSYPTVWEYQYTGVLPVLGILLLWDGSLLTRRLRGICVMLGGCVFLPSLYFLSGSPTPSPGVMTLTRLDRVLPVTLLFVILLWAVSRAWVNAFAQQPSAAETRPDCSSLTETQV